MVIMELMDALEARTRKHWRIRQEVDALDLARKLGLHPLVATLLINRGLDDADRARAFLNPTLSDLHDPALLPGVTAAAERIGQAVADAQPIVIYGDYDVDGITAGAILWHTLTLAGANVSTYVPHRIDEGYGLNVQAIEQLAEGRPLIVSVDCGITAVEPVRVAKQLGLDLIITDHHEFDPHNLPDAHTIVHPRFTSHASSPQPAYPFGDLCGAGVAFKLAWQVAKVHCGCDRLPDRYKALLIDLLSLAALGTVADVVPLVDENRVLTRFGLGRVKQTRFAGLNALIDVARLRDKKIDSYHVGFVLGPRLNACGRMGHAQRAVHLLTDASPDEARRIAAFLNSENERRRATERTIFAEARQMVTDDGCDRADRRAIVVGKAGWHPGVLGVVASRLAEAYGRPAVVLNFEGGVAHGSARSVVGVSIHEALAHCGEPLDSFGGHAMAAGLRLGIDRVDALRDALVGFVNDKLAVADLVGAIEIDAVCRLDELSLQLFEQVQALAPFGRANPTPVLCVRGVTLAGPPRRIGAAGQHLRLDLRQGGHSMQAVAFGMGDLADDLAAGAELDVVFEPKVSTWQGLRRAELHVKDLRSVPVGQQAGPH